MTWHTLAACRGMDTTIFYPRVGENATEAKLVCAGCDVRAECLTTALADEATGHRFGVRGGLTPRERDDEARRRRIRFVRPPAPCGTEAAYVRHLRSGEQPCWGCREAYRSYQARKRQEPA